MESINNQVHLGLEIPDNAPDQLIDYFLEGIKTSGLEIKVHKKPALTIMAALEWAIPTMIVIFCFKSYFDGFLKEAGKDHYLYLKKWLKTMVSTISSLKVHRITADLSTSKIDNNDHQSKKISILIQTNNGRIVKLLFDEDLEVSDWENAIDQLLDMVIENFEKYPNDKLTNRINTFEKGIKSELYAIIDKESKQLVFYDEKGMIRLYSDYKNRIK